MSGEAQHTENLRHFSQRGGVLDTRAETATTNNPDWFMPPSGGGKPIATPAREDLHETIIKEIWAQNPDVAYEKKAFVMAGPPGAGKSSIPTPKGYLAIDSDDIKAHLLRHARADGSLENWIKPQAVKDLEAAGERWDPMELSPLVHDEAGIIATALREDALARGANVIIDGVLANETKAQQLGHELAHSEYTARVVAMEASPELCAVSREQRWLAGREAATNDPTGQHLGGRWVPSGVARGLQEDGPDSLRTTRVARKLAETCPAVTQFQRYRRTEQGVTQLEDLTKRGGRLIPTQAARAASITDHTRTHRTPQRNNPRDYTR